jgi:hypothetical protein
MEINLTEQGTFEILWDKMDIFISLLALGFSIALVVVVIVAGVRLGWRLWPWVLAVGALAWWLV